MSPLPKEEKEEVSSAQKKGEVLLAACQGAQSSINTLAPGTICATLNAPTGPHSSKERFLQANTQNIQSWWL